MSRQHVVSWCFKEHRQISKNIFRVQKYQNVQINVVDVDFLNSKLTISKAILGVTMSAEKPCREAIQLQKVQFTRSSVYTMQHQTVPYNTIWCHTIPVLYTMKHHTIPCNSMQYHTIPGPVTESPIHSVVCLSVNRMNSPPVQKEQIQMNGENKKNGAEMCFWNLCLQ